MDPRSDKSDPRGARHRRARDPRHDIGGASASSLGAPIRLLRRLSRTPGSAGAGLRATPPLYPSTPPNGPASPPPAPDSQASRAAATSSWERPMKFHHMTISSPNG